VLTFQNRAIAFGVVRILLRRCFHPLVGHTSCRHNHALRQTTMTVPKRTHHCWELACLELAERCSGFDERHMSNSVCLASTKCIHSASNSLHHQVSKLTPRTASAGRFRYEICAKASMWQGTQQCPNLEIGTHLKMWHHSQ
jgi:hypothetical protein